MIVPVPFAMIPTLPSSSLPPRRPFVLTSPSYRCCWVVIHARRASPASVAECATLWVGLELHCFSPSSPNFVVNEFPFPNWKKTNNSLLCVCLVLTYGVTTVFSATGSAAASPCNTVRRARSPVSSTPVHRCLVHRAASGQGGCACWRGGACIWNQGALGKL